MKQLEISFVPDQQKVSGADVAPDAKIAALQRFCARDRENIPYVEKYSPNRRKQKYYRLSWRERKKMKHLHVPGGNVNAILAQYRAGKLRQLINRGADLDEVIAQVKTYAQGEV